MASYLERKSSPSEVMQLDGYTVDFCEAQPDLMAQASLSGPGCTGGRFFFHLVKEGDSMMFATDEEQERQNWVQAVYRATGQTHKPTALSTAPTAATQPPAAGQVAPPNGPTRAKQSIGELDRGSRKNPLDEYCTVNSWTLNHTTLFKCLQSCTLKHRLSDPYVSLGWFSPSEMFVLDEYCARYAVRGCHRHLFYLSDLLDLAETGTMVDPKLIHYSYAFCCSHVFGNSSVSIPSEANIQF
ncbi:hypothetical protein Ciccas_006909 [Cichlidogyrus casuarinus]|uniref:PH domain-containing protein n=1 Tax=Cichlidogyrus casuarinus TaxID=1844966 RepID=A0ABD2Q518_9PLAT